MFALTVGARVRLAPHYCRVVCIPLDGPLARRVGTVGAVEGRAVAVNWDDGSSSVFSRDALRLAVAAPEFAIAVGG